MILFFKILFTTLFRSHLIFKETVEGDLGFKKTARNKRKDIRRKKNITRLVKGDMEIVGKGEM